VIGIYTVIDSTDRELSEARSLAAAKLAVKTHLLVDGEDPPLRIFAPDGNKIAEGVLDNCGRVVIRTTSLTKKYDIEEVITKWGSPIQ
jgi:hypothetical protein